MCGRLELTGHEYADRLHVARELGIRPELIERFIRSDYFDKYDSYDRRPEQRHPVGIADTVAVMRWGWHPAWMKGPLINARWETVPEKNTFRRAFLERRCVVPATGYYEWRRDAKDKPLAKFAFKAHDGGLLLIAGLWADEKDKKTGEPGRHFLVLTREMKALAEIHDRTPVMLTPDAAEAWLDPRAPERELFEAAASLGDDHLIAREVTFDKAAGKVDGPHLSKSLGEPWPWETL